MIMFFEGDQVVIQGESPSVERVGRSLARKFQAANTAATCGKDEYRFVLAQNTTRTRVRDVFAEGGAK